MKGNPRHRIGALAVLGALAVAVLFIGPTFVGPAIIGTVLGPLIIGLFVAELDRSGGLFAVRIVRLAALLLPTDDRDVADEWEDHVLAAGESGLVPVFSALSIGLWAAPRMALRSRSKPLLVGALSAFVGAIYCLGPAPDEAPSGGNRRTWSGFRMHVLTILQWVSIVTWPLLIPYSIWRLRRHLPLRTLSPKTQALFGLLVVMVFSVLSGVVTGPSPMPWSPQAFIWGVVFGFAVFPAAALSVLLAHSAARTIERLSRT